MASAQCIIPDEKTSVQEQEQMIHIQTEPTLSHEKAGSVTQRNCQTRGQQGQAHVSQTKNPAPVAMPSHEKNDKKTKDKKEHKDKDKKEHKDKDKKEKKETKDKKDKKEKKGDDKKEKKGDDKKKEKSAKKK